MVRKWLGCGVLPTTLDIGGPLHLDTVEDTLGTVKNCLLVFINTHCLTAPRPTFVPVLGFQNPAWSCLKSASHKVCVCVCTPTCA